jgi:hypothetical protein
MQHKCRNFLSLNARVRKTAENLFNAYVTLYLSQDLASDRREVSGVKIQTMVAVPAVNVTKSA